MSDHEKFNELCQLARENSYLTSTMALLEWDQQTKLPKRAGDFRAEQVTFLAGEIHRRETNPRIGELVRELAASELALLPNSDTGATILELKRNYEKKIKLPERLVQELARAAATGQQVWVEARKANDFSRFAPHLKEMFALKQEQADALGYEDCRYDALLDDYEPRAKTREVAAVLNALKDELVPLVALIGESQTQIRTEVLHRRFPTDAQRTLGVNAAAKIGFDFERGRLDVTHHPFCTELGPHDVRITTRYDESFFNTAFFGTLHEAGHGIYEQGLRSEFYGLPPGQYCSLGIHESQSRLWENLVGRSRGFWAFFYPEAQRLFPESLADVSPDEFFAAVNRVAPSLIRIEADAATYDLHIIIRFQLEQAVIDGQLDTDDLPAAWDEKYEEFLGIRPESDANGVLQDIHWSAGLVGYFATYSLGNLYASQLFDKATEDLGDLDAMFHHGEFGPLKKWLNREIHARGRCYSSLELAKKVTGKDLSFHPLMAQLREKLTPIYSL
jgi:carboxypeptidase Taq